MIGRIAPWRHVVVALSVAACVVLGLLGFLGGRGERFDAKQVIVEPAGGDAVRITEVVDQDFGDRRRHGYQRIVPNDFGVPTEVTAESSTAPDRLSIQQVAGGTRIRIGDPDEIVTGQHRYVLSYVLPDARLSTGELALDVIGTDEELETGRFEVVVSGFVLDDLRCDVGAAGRSGGCELRGEPGDYRVVFEPLRPGEGITVGGTIVDLTGTELVAAPDEPPAAPDRRGWWALILGVVGTAAGAGVYVWARRRGRNEVVSGGAADAAFGTGGWKRGDDGVPTRWVADDRMAELATTEFVPPDGVEPWEGAVLLDEQLGDDKVAAWFAELAAIEAITLTEDDDGALVIGSGPKRDRVERKHGKYVDRILKGRDRVTLGEYDEQLSAVWRSMAKEQKQRVAKSGWWLHRPPGHSTALDAVFGIVPFVAVFVAIVFFTREGADYEDGLDVLGRWPVALAVGIVVPAITAYLAYRFLLSARSATGSALALRTESFRRFLDLSEGQHVDWAWERGVLREYTAWAVALGEAKAWGDALDASQVPASNRALIAAPLLIHTHSSSIASSHTAPSSSGGGGGFGGGGVGGGGGGGSSGSW